MIIFKNIKIFFVTTNVNVLLVLFIYILLKLQIIYYIKLINDFIKK